MTAGADPDLTYALAKAVRDLYEDAALRMMSVVTARLGRDLDAPGWAEAKLRELVILRNEARAIVESIEVFGPRAVHAAVIEAGRIGAQLGAAEMREAGLSVSGRLIGTHERAVQALARETALAVRSTHTQILRSAVDVYRRVIAEVSAPGVVTGTDTRRAATQRALNRFADEGVTGFVDRSGRHWSMESYAEMATRTAAGHAQVEGTLDRFEAAGRDLVIVSDAPQECSKCRPWEGKVLSVSGTDPRYPSVAEATSSGLLHANCFPVDVLVSGPDVGAADTRWYEGELVVIHTAGGQELPVTPNHPVLTTEGWVAAGALHEGHHVIRHAPREGMHLVGPDRQHVPATIGEVARAVEQASTVGAVRVPATSVQFHGDGLGGEVHVVAADGFLGHGVDAPLGEPSSDRPLVVGGVGLGPLLPERPLGEVVVGALHAPHGLVGGGHLSGSLLCRHGVPLPALGLAAGAPDPEFEHPLADGGLADAEVGGDGVLGLACQVAPFDLGDVGGMWAAHQLPGFRHRPHDASGPESLVDVGGADVEGGRHLAARLASEIAPDQVVRVDRRDFAGHVYNLQTVDGWYAANGIVVHNCRHRLGAYVEGLTRPFGHTADPQGDADRQRLRTMERHVRHWKMRAAAALDEPTRKASEAKAREWQARIREHVATTSAKRQPARERIGSAR